MLLIAPLKGRSYPPAMQKATFVTLVQWLLRSDKLKPPYYAPTGTIKPHLSSAPY